MRHEWILEVLADLQVYAERNGLQATALKAQDALRVARAEMAMLAGGQGNGGSDEGGQRRRIS